MHMALFPPKVIIPLPYGEAAHFESPTHQSAIVTDNINRLLATINATPPDKTSRKLKLQNLSHFWQKNEKNTIPSPYVRVESSVLHPSHGWRQSSKEFLLQTSIKAIQNSLKKCSKFHTSKKSKVCISKAQQDVSIPLDSGISLEPYQGCKISNARTVPRGFNGLQNPFSKCLKVCQAKKFKIFSLPKKKSEHATSGKGCSSSGTSDPEASFTINLPGDHREVPSFPPALAMGEVKHRVCSRYALDEATCQVSDPDSQSVDLKATLETCGHSEVGLMAEKGDKSLDPPPYLSTRLGKDHKHEKGAELKTIRKVKTSKPFFPLTVSLPQKQQAFLILPSTTTLAEVQNRVCKKYLLDQDAHQFVDPRCPDSPVSDFNITLSSYGFSEIIIKLKEGTVEYFPTSNLFMGGGETCHAKIIQQERKSSTSSCYLARNGQALSPVWNGEKVET